MFCFLTLLHPASQLLVGYVWLGSHVGEKSRGDYLFVRIRENMIENSWGVCLVKVGFFSSPSWGKNERVKKKVSLRWEITHLPPLPLQVGLFSFSFLLFFPKKKKKKTLNLINYYSIYLKLLILYSILGFSKIKPSF